MYTQHFKLSEKPFNVTPNPRFVFLSKQHREVFAHLLYGLQNRCGFIEITGEVGAGKTTALRTLFHQLDSDEYRLALIFNPALSADELLEAICQEFAIPIVAGDRRGLLDRLNQFLLKENAAGRTVVLVIDEAQNLAVPVLEQIRLLSNLETETDKLIQIVLVGQPELGELLSQPNLRQFSQRVSVRYHLRPMDQEDTRDYIRHRLTVAGSEQELFSESAFKTTYKLSRGLPRLINIVSDRALLAAYSEDLMKVDKKHVLKASNELLRNKSEKPSSGLFWATAAVVLGALVVFSYLFYFQAGNRPLVTEQAQEQPSQPRLLVDYSESVRKIRHVLSGDSEIESFSGATRNLMKLWRVESLSVPDRPSGMTGYLQSLPDSGWQWTPYSGDLLTLLSLDVPIVLELSLPAVSGRRYLTVQSLDADLAHISLADESQHDVPLKVLSSLYTGRAYVLWRNYLQLSSFTQLGQRDLDVSQIQNMLLQSGYYFGSITGEYDVLTIEAVTRLQADRGVIQDGRIGPLTLMLLYQQGGTYNSPRLTSRHKGEQS